MTTQFSPPKILKRVTLEFKIESQAQGPFGLIVNYNLDDFRPYFPETFHNLVCTPKGRALKLSADVLLYPGDTHDIYV